MEQMYAEIEIYTVSRRGGTYDGGHFCHRYQELGRGGRDGAPSRASLICHPPDLACYEGEFYRGGESDASKKRLQHSQQGIREYMLNSSVCRWHQMLSHFREELPAAPCGSCDICLARAAKLLPAPRDYTDAVRLVLDLVHLGQRKEAVPPNEAAPCSWTRLWELCRKSETALGEARAKLPRCLRSQERLKAFLTAAVCPAGLVKTVPRQIADHPAFHAYRLSTHGEETRERLSRDGEVSLALLISPYLARSYLPKSPKVVRLEVPNFLLFGAAGSALGSAGGGSEDDAGLVADAEACAKCGEADDAAGNEILLCDGVGCNRGFHQRCLKPALLEVPEGAWLCPHCKKEGNHHFIERVVSHTGKGDKRMFKVKWRLGDTSIEPLEHIKHTQELRE